MHLIYFHLMLKLESYVYTVKNIVIKIDNKVFIALHTVKNRHPQQACVNG